MLDRAVADRMLVEAAHFPSPACGHMVKRGNGYELVPTMSAIVAGGGCQNVAPAFSMKVRPGSG